MSLPAPVRSARGLADLLVRVERGERLPADPWLSVVPEPSPGEAAVVAFPGRIVVAADVEPDWVFARCPEGDLSAPLNPPFLGALEQHLGRRVNGVDALLVAKALGAVPELALRPLDDADHPRVRRACRYRDDVRVWAVDGAILIVGRGLGGRWEAAVEVDEAHRDRGLGRRLARAARSLIPGRRPVWAQVAPGNAASVRAFLAAGYQPVGAEALLIAH